MSKIYTKTGDMGSTSLVDGTRIAKDDIRIEAYGSVDELNSWMGLLATDDGNKSRQGFLHQIQNTLFIIGSNLACPQNNVPNYIPKLESDDITQLEIAIDDCQKKLPELKNFILPGGEIVSAQCQITRTVCRRAERQVIKLSQLETVNNKIIIYLNRLSDYLFVLARLILMENDGQEIEWKSK